MVKNLLIWGAIGLVLATLFNFFESNQAQSQKVSFSELLFQTNEGNVKEVSIEDQSITGVFTDGRGFNAYLPADSSTLITALLENNVVVNATSSSGSNMLMMFIISWFPLILIIGLWVFFMRQMQSGGNQVFSFGKVKGQSNPETLPKVTFMDVAGIDEAKHEVSEIVSFLKKPDKYTAIGGDIPTGILLTGSPGTGKTLLAKAIAGEAKVPFFSISGSDFVEMFVGVGAGRVRDLFEQAKKSIPCLIYIDEIDAVGRRRGTGMGGGNDEREQTLNQLLVEMDGFETNAGLIVIASTNRPDVLDPALLRPGRFDRRVVVQLPDIKGRKEILAVHSRDKQMADNIDLEAIARGTPGFSGADLATLINEASLLAARNNKDKISFEELEEARDKIMMGAERKGIHVPEDEKKITAYHEIGHALIAELLPEVDPVHKVTVLPRGLSRGATHLLPEEDHYCFSKEQLLGRITMMLGGRAAEELNFKHFTTGASDDIKKATSLARRMVSSWGMSKAVGPVNYSQGNSVNFLGREILKHRQYGEATANKIDREIKRIISTCYARTKKLLKANHDTLVNLANILIEKETIDRAEILQAMEASAVKTAS